MSKKVALVTGAAQGIGRGIIQRLLADGWAVVAADADSEALHDLGTSPSLAATSADVSKDENVRGLMSLAREKFGGLDAVINNAGIAIWKTLAETSLDDWHRVLEVNLTGPFLCAKHAAPYLAERKGSIVNIGSIRAQASEAGQVSYGYSASKGGLVALTHALAVELGPKVRVNCISPGWIDVSGPRWRKGEAQAATLRDIDHSQHPAGRVGTPEDVAGLVAWLIGPDAGFVTGQNFTVDGGMTVKLGYAE